MKQRLLIALFTILGFAVGFGARVLTERQPVCLPAPGAEFARPQQTAVGTAGTVVSESEREKFFAEIEKMRPKIEAYRNRVGEIYWGFDQDFGTILNPEQRARWDEHLKKGADSRAARQAREVGQPGPLTDEQVEQLRREPLWNALGLIAVEWRIQRLTDEYHLTPEQQAKTRDFLEFRRQQFLQLLDSSEPPSLGYSELASRAQKLLAQPKK
jgi:hypothetical protein